ATRRQGLKRIKKRPLSERSEFRTLPVSVPGGACSPCEARTAILGAAFFAPLFWRSKKAGRPPGRTPGYSPRQCKSHASPARHQQQRRLASTASSRIAATAASQLRSYAPAGRPPQDQLPKLNPHATLLMRAACRVTIGAFKAPPAPPHRIQAACASRPAFPPRPSFINALSLAQYRAAMPSGASVLINQGFT
ncbi:MAG: hypothetical protein JWM30_4080, partial [Burkholderia sp.]|nr:hypothetical protein [Burkholderia sp.]